MSNLLGDFLGRPIPGFSCLLVVVDNLVNDVRGVQGKKSQSSLSPTLHFVYIFNFYSLVLVHVGNTSHGHRRRPEVVIGMKSVTNYYHSSKQWQCAMRYQLLYILNF